MDRMLKFSLVLLCLSIAVSVVHAQEKCSLQTIAGTYVMFERGSSLMLNPTSPPQVQPFLSGAVSPFANIIEITFTPDGVGDGYYWMWAGTIRATLEPVPAHVMITELNEDCTGKFQYSTQLPGSPGPVNIQERFIVFDEGREIRTIPISIQNGTPLVAWIGTAHRISKGAAPVNSCGPQTAYGRYLTTCENIVVRPVVSPYAIADTLMLNIDISMGGEYTGTLYERIGEKAPQMPITGTMIVNPDCSSTGTLTLPSPPFSGNIRTRGVFFDEGKEYYMMAIDNDSATPEQQGIRYSFCHGTRINHSL